MVDEKKSEEYLTKEQGKDLARLLIEMKQDVEALKTKRESSKNESGEDGTYDGDKDEIDSVREDVRNLQGMVYELTQRFPKDEPIEPVHVKTKEEVEEGSRVLLEKILNEANARDKKSKREVN